MKLVYDRDSDTLHIRFNDFPIARSATSNNGTTFDFDGHDRLVAIEMKSASFQIGEPCTFEIDNQISHFALHSEL